MEPQSLEEIAEMVSQVLSGLRGIVLLGTGVGEYDCDNPAYQFACALEPLADRLETAYCALENGATERRGKA